MTFFLTKAATGIMGKGLLFAIIVAATSTGKAAATTAQTLVDDLDIVIFKRHIEDLSSVEGPTSGTRFWNTAGNLAALTYIENELGSYGYTNIVRHPYSYGGQPKESIYATKIGSVEPDKMYIVSAHMDSVNFDDPTNAFAPGANDDASGCALVLEAARVFMSNDIETKYSIRFIFWNNEEQGLIGSKAYVASQRAKQGIEDPPGSGQYEEPTWLGIIQHDQLLWDHDFDGLGSDQSLNADMDIEYKSGTTFASDSLTLANYLHAVNPTYAIQYPSEVSSAMCCTDSVPFQQYCPAISLRDNRRLAEIGQGSNPTWHRNTDQISTYSDADFALAFDFARTTVGAVAELVEATTNSDAPSAEPVASPTDAPSAGPTALSSDAPSPQSNAPTSDAPSDAPSTAPVNSPVQQHWASCGSQGKCTSETEQFYDDSTLHEVRCCSDNAITNWVKRPGCAVWGESMFGPAKECFHDMTYDEAQAICTGNGGRLCTKEELMADCTRGSGCSHDFDLIWSSTDGSEELGYLGCGRVGRCSPALALASVESLHEVRCCSDTATTGWPQVCSTIGNVWGESNIGEICYHSETRQSAANICAAEGGRLCTMQELEDNCTAGTGCNHDNDLVWTSD